MLCHKIDFDFLFVLLNSNDEFIVHYVHVAAAEPDAITQRQGDWKSSSGKELLNMSCDITYQQLIHFVST